MIVVINPNGSGGHSFKGLHAYCAHDADKATSSERVDWMATRNVASDPERAWKLMVATKFAENELKQAAGVKAGRKARQGAALHIVMSFDEDEPQSREAMEAAADSLLSSLGADPAKMRGKSKPKRRQFADEHQAVIYAHKDTGNTHLHIMVNAVHPETGIRLPSGNDHLKASNWALKFSKEHGTSHKTPARAENQDGRDAGEFVKGGKRKSRGQYEGEQSLRNVSNDNDRVQAFLTKQKAMDAALYDKGRALAKRHFERLDALQTQHVDKKALVDQAMKAQINREKAVIREDYRPQWRELKDRQMRERETFSALEKSFFGRTKNAFQTLRKSYEDQDSVIARSFRILASAGERKTYFERAQDRAKTSLERQQSDRLTKAVEEAKAVRTNAYQSLREDYAQARNEERLEQNQNIAALKNEWKERNADRKQAAGKFQNMEQTRPPIGDDFGRSRMTDEYFKNLEQRLKLSELFEPEQASPAREQDNERDEGQGQ